MKVVLEVKFLRGFELKEKRFGEVKQKAFFYLTMYFIWDEKTT